MDPADPNDYLSKMEHKDVIQRGNSLQVKFIVTNYNTPCAVKNSQEFVICGAAVFQTKVVASQIHNGHTNIYVNLIFIRFFKERPDEDDLVYNMRLTCPEFSITDKSFTSDDGTWHLVHENKKQQYSFCVSLTMDVASGVNSFAPLYEDDDLVDFELRGAEGEGVKFHRAVLAAASPVLRRMLAGSWREAHDQHVDVPHTTTHTLQSLKDYIYLRKLPEAGVEPLLLLASYYMMSDLQHKCVYKLLQALTPQNACDLLEFAAKNKVTRLVLAILEAVEKGQLQVKDIKRHVQTTM